MSTRAGPESNHRCPHKEAEGELRTQREGAVETEQRG